MYTHVQLQKAYKAWKNNRSCLSQAIQDKKLKETHLFVYRLYDPWWISDRRPALFGVFSGNANKWGSIKSVLSLETNLDNAKKLESLILPNFTPLLINPKNKEIVHICHRSRIHCTSDHAGVLPFFAVALCDYILEVCFKSTYRNKPTYAMGIFCLAKDFAREVCPFKPDPMLELVLPRVSPDRQFRFLDINAQEKVESVRRRLKN
jgi:hypothetical protein